MLEFTPSIKMPRGEFKQRFVMGAGGGDNQIIQCSDSQTGAETDGVVSCHRQIRPRRKTSFFLHYTGEPLAKPLAFPIAGRDVSPKRPRTAR
ncbi:MAG: hypothetical protein ABR497_12575, partial [Kiritimatiellia bacterium]